MSDPSPVVEAIASVGTFAVAFAVLCFLLSKFPAGGVAPRRGPDGPGPSRADVPPSSAALTERDGPGPTTPLATAGGDA